METQWTKASMITAHRVRSMRRAGLAQGGEEAALAQLGYGELYVADLGGQQPRRLPLRWVLRVSLRS